jgi:hypothetical protein
MAGCMVFVFAALGEFAVVKVLDVRYQSQKNERVTSVPRILPMVIPHHKYHQQIVYKLLSFDIILARL